MDELKGVVSKSGVVFGKTGAREYPYFAFGFIGNVEGGGKKAVWYPKTQISNVVSESYKTAEEETSIDDVTADFVAVGLKNNNVMYASFDSYRLGSSLELFEKFITQPVYDEEQWTTLSAGGDA